ncbi:hypothetical protein DFS34DRAFT_691459 [Phlyctochytrium arcticum]|nr:hypothetical protein DFS34DRAFT_691459 [Phlyctochytrium arcticum]
MSEEAPAERLAAASNNLQDPDFGDDLDPDSDEEANHPELQEAYIAQIMANRRARPLETQKAYDTRQEQYCQWCNSQGWDDTASHRRLLLWLRDVIIPGGWRTKPGGERREYSRSSLGRGAKTSPRHKTISGLLKAHVNRLHDGHNDSFADCGERTLIDTYEMEDMESLALHWSNQAQAEAGLRNASCFLLQHATMGRGQAPRALQLSHLYMHELPRMEGPTPAFAMLLISREGKVNQMERKKMTGCIRHKNAIICPIGTAAFSLFYRFHI